MSVRPSSQDAISVSAAAELTGASSKSLRRRIERGTLGSIRQGGRRLIPVSELIRVGLLDESGQALAAAPVLSGGATMAPGRVDDAGATAWAGTAPGGPAPPSPTRPAPPPVAQTARPAPAAPTAAAAEHGGSPAPPGSRSPGPPPSQPTGAAARAADSPVPGPRPQASAPEVRAPWSPASGSPRPSTPQEYPRAVADQAPPAGGAPGIGAAAEAPTTSTGGLSPQESRRIAAMVELVMHQMRTINALNARLSRLEARLDELADLDR